LYLQIALKSNLNLYKLKNAEQATSKILPKMSLRDKNNGYGITKQRILDKLHAFFERYFSLG